MHPSVDSVASTKTPSIEIDCARLPARTLLKETIMRTSLGALLCASLATACAPIGEHAGSLDGPDAGIDGAVSAACDQLETKTMDITISGSAGFTNLPAGCWKLNGKLTLTCPAVTSLA